jgi:transposase-like protein
VLGVVGRETGRVRLEVVRHSTRAEVEPRVLACTGPAAAVHTDEWRAYGRLAESGRGHATVCHNPARPGGPEYARDDDGDGVREVHCNTMEGTWTGLRNFLRTFRGVSKKYLAQYVAVFEWGHCLKAATVAFLRALLGGTHTTELQT